VIVVIESGAELVEGAELGDGGGTGLSVGTVESEGTGHSLVNVVSIGGSETLSSWSQLTASDGHFVSIGESVVIDEGLVVHCANSIDQFVGGFAEFTLLDGDIKDGTSEGLGVAVGDSSEDVHVGVSEHLFVVVGGCVDLEVVHLGTAVSEIVGVIGGTSDTDSLGDIILIAVDLLVLDFGTILNSVITDSFESQFTTESSGQIGPFGTLSAGT